MEGKTIPEISDAAEAYVTVRDERMLMTEEEVTKRNTLIEVMRKHTLLFYRDPEADLEVVITEGDAKVKVSKAAAEKAEKDAA